MKTKTNLLALRTFLAGALFTANGQDSSPQLGRAIRGPLRLPAPGDGQPATPVEPPPEPNLTPATAPVSGLRREVFLNLAGATLIDLTNHAHFPNQPDLVDTVATFEAPTNSGDNYGVRLSGYVVPTINGLYQFSLSANGQAALYVSLDEHPEHKRLVAVEPVGNGSREWVVGRDQASRGNPPQNISATIRLVARQAYYVEALMKAGTGDDNLGVTWQRIGTAAPANDAPPIPSQNLALTPPATSLPTTGAAVPELAAFDYEVLTYMLRSSTKTATLGVMKNGRMVLKRGYGWRDRARTQPMAPDGRMRLASISKTIAAATVKQLIAQGRLTTNTLVFPLLGIQPYNGVSGDARFNSITVGDLLIHRAGWDRDLVGDPIDKFDPISTTLGLDHPASAVELLSYQLSQPLQFSPGSRFAYSNVGYLALGRIVEMLTGRPYFEGARRLVLRPMGIKRIQLSRTLEKLREPDEPFYDTEESGVNVLEFPATEQVRVPEGGLTHWDVLDSPACMMASMEDLLRFAQGFHLGGPFNRFGPSDYSDYHLFGDSRVGREGIETEMDGGWPGTFTILEERPDGVDWAVLFNRLNRNQTDFPDAVQIDDRAITNITVWPGDNATRIELASDSFTVDESEGSLTIGVRRTGWSTGEVSAIYTTLSGSALAGPDFSSVTGRVTFADNECAKRITIPILDDALAEPAKSFGVVLSDPAGGALLGLASATVTIEDDDHRQPPAVAITAPASGAIFQRGTNVALSAAPSDSDGSIYTVTFWAGPTLLGEENKPPYTFVWKTPGPGTYVLTARATDNHGLTATSAPVAVTIGAGLASASSGTFRAEYWHRRPDVTMAMVTNYVHFPDRPTGVEYLDLFEMPTNRADYYGTRMRGYVHPPVTGSYVFWIAADVRAELWLSSDAHPETKQRIASAPFPTGLRQWTAQTAQQSAPVQLVGGQRYYLEALHKESIGADYLAVGWQLPDGTLERPIPGARLSPPNRPLLAVARVFTFGGAPGNPTNLVVLSANGSNATVLLDGSLSSDPDHDSLEFLWLSTINHEPSTRLASGVVATNALPIGSHTLLLVVGDGLAAATNAVSVEVITSAQAVERLLAVANSDIPHRQPLIATLNTAIASIDPSNPTVAINQLLAFQNQVRSQVAPLDVTLAAAFIQSAQAVIDVLSGGNTNPGGRPHARFTAVQRQTDGRVQMQFTAQPGRLHVIEVSANLDDWQAAGVATDRGDGQFEFEDNQAAGVPRRFYRVRCN